MHNPEELLRLSEELADHRHYYLVMKQVCDRWDRGKNSVLSKIVARLRGLPGSPKGEQGLWNLALGDSEYQTYLDQWNKDEQLMIGYRIEFENAETRFEALQSVIAYQREAVKRNMG